MKAISNREVKTYRVDKNVFRAAKAKARKEKKKVANLVEQFLAAYALTPEQFTEKYIQAEDKVSKP
jgi:hypothetical protein